MVSFGGLGQNQVSFVTSAESSFDPRLRTTAFGVLCIDQSVLVMRLLGRRDGDRLRAVGDCPGVLSQLVLWR